MGRPACSLCARVGSECIFPTKRKRPEPRRNSINKKGKRSDSRDADTASDKILDDQDWPATRSVLRSILRHQDRLMQLIGSTRPSLDGDNRPSPGSSWSGGSERSPPRFQTRDAGQSIESTQAIESNAPQSIPIPSFLHDPSDQHMIQLQTNEEQADLWQIQQPCGSFLEDESYLSQGLLPDEVLQWVVQSPVRQAYPRGLQYSDSVDKTRSEARSASSGFSLSPSGGLLDTSGVKTYSLTLPEDQVVQLYESLAIHLSLLI